VSGLRPVQHLESVSRDYPGLWKKYASILDKRHELGDWPSWCFCPVGAAFAIVAGVGNPATRTLDVARVAALAAWRPTQGIYRFDSTLLQDLLATPVDGDIPGEHLQRLPEWCVYVELDSADALGFFAHLECDLRTRSSELILLIDYSERFVPVVIQLRGTLEQALESFVSHASSQLADGVGLAPIAEITRMVAPFVSVLLYLCAEDAEMKPTRDPKRTHVPIAPKRSKDGELYLPPAKRPEVWQTGFKLGAALREAFGHRDELSGKAPRGHIRRAHWHSYWKGSGDERKLELRWLPPIPVKLDVPERATVRNVKSAM
jgi:hypothetical protein